MTLHPFTEETAMSNHHDIRRLIRLPVGSRARNHHRDRAGHDPEHHLQVAEPAARHRAYLSEFLGTAALLFTVVTVVRWLFGTDSALAHALPELGTADLAPWLDAQA